MHTAQTLKQQLTEEICFSCSSKLWNDYGVREMQRFNIYFPTPVFPNLLIMMVVVMMISLMFSPQITNSENFKGAFLNAFTYLSVVLSLSPGHPQTPG